MHRGADQPMPAPSVSPVGAPPAPFAFAPHVQPSRVRVPQAFVQQPQAQQQQQHVDPMSEMAPVSQPQAQPRAQQPRKPRASPQTRAPPNPPQPPATDDVPSHAPTDDDTAVDVANTGLETLADVVSTAPPDAVRLSASGNCLSVVPRLSYFRGLRTVLLANNRISTVDSGAFHSMTALEHLDLQGNQLASIPHDALVGCTRLKTLNLRGNLLTRAPRLAKCAVTELLLDNNAIEAVETLPDDVGLDTWGSVRRLGLSGNKISNWLGLKGLAAMEGLETLDIRRNPFHTTVGNLFNYRCFVVWMCPMLAQLDNAPVTEGEVGEATSLFTDAAGNISDLALMLDDERQFQGLLAYLSQAIPPVGGGGQGRQPPQQGMGLPVTGSGGTPAAQAPPQQAAAAAALTGPAAEQLATMRQKVKEMSQVVKVLHRHHLKERADAARTIQAWFRGCTARTRTVPVAYQSRFARFGVYQWPKRARVAQDMAALRESIDVDFYRRSQNVNAYADSEVSCSTGRRRVGDAPAKAAPAPVAAWRLRVDRERAVRASRVDEQRLRSSYRWNDNPSRLHLTPCVPLRHPAGRVRYVVTVQRMARGFLVRNRVREIRLRYYAALTIQCAWRGYRTWALRTQQPQLFRTMASVRALEGDCRPRMTEMQDQIELLQNALRVLWNESRGMQAHHARVSHDCAVRIQRVVRGYLARRRYAKLYASYVLYCRERGLPSREELLMRDRSACVKIQAVWRGARGRARCREMHERMLERREVRELKGQVQMLFAMVQKLSQQQQPQPRAASPPTHERAVELYDLVREAPQAIEQDARAPLPAQHTTAAAAAAAALTDIDRHHRPTADAYGLEALDAYRKPHPTAHNPREDDVEDVVDEEPAAAAAAHVVHDRMPRISGYSAAYRKLREDPTSRGARENAVPPAGDTLDSNANDSYGDGESLTSASTGLRRTLFRQSMSCESAEADDSAMYAMNALTANARQAPAAPAAVAGSAAAQTQPAPQYATTVGMGVYLPPEKDVGAAGSVLGSLCGSGVVEGSHNASSRYNTSKLDESQSQVSDRGDDDAELLHDQASPGDDTRDVDEDVEVGGETSDEYESSSPPRVGDLALPKHGWTARSYAAAAARAEGTTPPMPDRRHPDDVVDDDDEDMLDDEDHDYDAGGAYGHHQHIHHADAEADATGVEPRAYAGYAGQHAHHHHHHHHRHHEEEEEEEDDEQDYAPDSARGSGGGVHGHAQEHYGRGLPRAGLHGHGMPTHARHHDDDVAGGRDLDEDDDEHDGGPAAAVHDLDLHAATRDDDDAEVDVDELRAMMREQRAAHLKNNGGLQFIQRNTAAAAAPSSIGAPATDAVANSASLYTVRQQLPQPAAASAAATRPAYGRWSAARGSDILPLAARAQNRQLAPEPVEDVDAMAGDERNHFRFNDLIAPPMRQAPAPPTELDLM